MSQFWQGAILGALAFAVGLMLIVVVVTRVQQQRAVTAYYQQQQQQHSCQRGNLSDYFACTLGQ